MRGVFIPGITVEALRNGSLAQIEELMVSGKMLEVGNLRVTRLTKEEIKEIRLHINRFKEKFCNRGWREEALMYQVIVDKLDEMIDQDQDEMILSAIEKQMDDLIRRQDAIDALDCINGTEEVLRSLPSAQPEVTEEAVKECCRKRCLCIVDGALLKKYTSAQLETATVTIGKTRGTDVLWYQCDGCGEPVAKEDCYCSKCGRRLRFE